MQALPFSACSEVVRKTLRTRLGAICASRNLVRALVCWTQWKRCSSISGWALYCCFRAVLSRPKHCNWTMCLHSSRCVCLHACISPSHSHRLFLSPTLYSQAMLLALFHPRLCPRTPASPQPSSSLSMKALTASRRNSATFKIKTRRRFISCWCDCLEFCYLVEVSVDFMDFLLYQYVCFFNCEIWPYLVVSLIVCMYKQRLPGTLIFLLLDLLVSMVLCYTYVCWFVEGTMLLQCEHNVLCLYEAGAHEWAVLLSCHRVIDVSFIQWHLLVCYYHVSCSKRPDAYVSLL